MTRVTVWSEFRHEKKNPIVAKIYPDGMHNAIGNHLKKDKSLDALHRARSTKKTMACRRASSTPPMCSSGGVTSPITK